VANALAGRTIAAVGVVLGIVAIFTKTLSFADDSVKYSDDGTIMAYLLIVLVLAALLLVAAYRGRTGLDLAVAAAGGAAFGFFLFIPAIYAFENLDFLAAGGWLGVCSALIPMGALIAHAAEQPASAAGTRLMPQLAAPVAFGLGLCLIGIWLKSGEAFDSESYWNLSASGDHWLGILMLVLVILGAVLLAGAVAGAIPGATTWVLVVSAVTFGLVEALLIGETFDRLGTVDAGGWLEAVGGLVLLLGAGYLWRSAAAGAKAPATTTAAPGPV